MSKLTIPIVIGKKYVRRDGVVVTARDGHSELCGSAIYVGDGGGPIKAVGMHVWQDTGRVNYGREDDTPFDLVADCIEPAVADPVPMAKPPALQPHPHAARMLEYAQDAAVTAEPWLLWQWRRDEDHHWTPCSVDHPLWCKSFEYRRKPRAILINGIEVPEPLRQAPSHLFGYWLASPTAEKFSVGGYLWEGTDKDRFRLQRGLIHSTQEAAAAHGRALASFTASAEPVA